MPEMSGANRLLGVLFQPGDGLIELRALPSRKRVFIQPGDMMGARRFIEEHRAENLYFAVAARRDSTSGRSENCSLVRAIYVDLDFKNKPELEARMALDSFPLKPSYTVNSGGGLHCYWLLSSALDLQREASQFRALLRAVAITLGADLSSAEPARVLRLPDTTNWKPDYPDHPQVRIESANPELVYELSDFEFLPPDEPERQTLPPLSNGNGHHHTHDHVEAMKRARAYARALPAAIQGNHGDQVTYEAALKIRDFGLSEDENYAVLAEEFNPRCDPSWSKRELQAKIRNAYKYARGQAGSKLNEERPSYKAGSTDYQSCYQTEVIQAESQEKPRKADLAFIPADYWRLYDVSDVQKWECPPLQPIIEGILAKGNLCWIAAETQTGKTLFMLFVCLQLLRRGKLFDKFPITPVNKILYLGLEDPARRFKARLAEMITKAIEAGRFVMYIAPGLSIADSRCFQFLENMIEEGGFDLVVVDTFQAATMGIPSFDDEKLSIVIRRLLEITRRLGTTIIVNDHFRKTQNHKKRIGLDLNDVKGSGGKLQNADVFLLMDRQNGQLRISGKSKEWDRPIGFLLNVTPQGSTEAEKFTYAGDLEDMAANMKVLGKTNRKKVLEAIPGDDWVTRAQIVIATGMTDRTVKNHIASLIKSDLVHTNGREGKAIRYQSGNGIGQGELVLFPNAPSDIDTES
jgi:DNA-binding transcriptional ArsR family regulator